MDINFLNITQENDSVDAIKINNITINDVNGVFQIKDSTGTLKTSEIAKTTSVNTSLSAYATTASTNAALATKQNVSGMTSYYTKTECDNRFGIYTPFIPSGSSESWGAKGEYAVDSTYLYICTDTNTWLRISGATF